MRPLPTSHSPVETVASTASAEQHVDRRLLEPGAHAVAHLDDVDEARLLHELAEEASAGAEHRELAQALHELDRGGVEPAQCGQERAALLARALGEPERHRRDERQERQQHERHQRMDERQGAEHAQGHDHRADIVAQHMRVEPLHEVGVRRRDRGQLAGAAAQHIGGRRALEPVIDADLQHLDQAIGEIVRDEGLPPFAQRGRQHRAAQDPEGAGQCLRRYVHDRVPDEPGAGRGRDHGRHLRDDAGEDGDDEMRALDRDEGQQRAEPVRARPLRGCADRVEGFDGHAASPCARVSRE